jgi:hypothetical protein
MGSVFSQLIDTLPFHLALTKLAAANGHESFRHATAQQARDYIVKLEAGGAVNQAGRGGGDRHMPDIPGPALSPTGYFLRDQAEARGVRIEGPPPRRGGWDRLWGWVHGQGGPTKVSEVRCRVPDYGYHAYRVFDDVEFGRYSGSTLLPEVKLWTTAGQELTLQLDEGSVHSRWLLKDGHAGPDSHWLWPLEARLDAGVVVAFAYSLSQRGADLVAAPIHLSSSSEAESRAAIDELSSGSERARWGDRVLQGDFMPIRSRTHRPSAEVGSRTHTEVRAPRLLVLVCFTTLRERADYDPGQVANFARVLPQIMIKATVPLAGMEAAIKMKRPAESTVQTEAGGEGSNHRTCHNESEGTIGTLIVTDLDIDRVGPDFGPHWSDIFAYYETDRSRLQGAIHVVDSSKLDVRELDPYGRRVMSLVSSAVGGHETTLIKRPRQGEFDNIHLAPLLRLPATTYTTRTIGLPTLDDPLTVTRFVSGNPVTDRGAMKLDHIAMAPFCSHDCLHTHWRWGKFLSDGKRWVKGWSSSLPYAVLGAPMVQHHQDVNLHLPMANAMVYAAEVRRRAPTDFERRQAEGDRRYMMGTRYGAPMESFEWQIVNHHGSGFVTSIHDTTKFGAARGAVSVERTIFFSNGSAPLDPTVSSAAHYWHMRYSFDVANNRVFERVDVTPAQRTRARRL